MASEKRHSPKKIHFHLVWCSSRKAICDLLLPTHSGLGHHPHHNCIHSQPQSHRPSALLFPVPSLPDPYRDSSSKSLFKYQPPNEACPTALSMTIFPHPPLTPAYLAASRIAPGDKQALKTHISISKSGCWLTSRWLTSQTPWTLCVNTLSHENGRMQCTSALYRWKRL